MIKNIIFDFGGVFLNLRKKATTELLSIYGINAFYGEFKAINQDYEKGLMTTEEWLTCYEDAFPEIPRQKIIYAWNAVILTFPEYRLQFIEDLALQKRYRLFLLSNTNELHIEKVKENMGIERYERFKNAFEKFYLSHEIGLRKPSFDVFKYVLDENDLNPRETLFIDDTYENLLMANELSIEICFFTPERDDITDLFRNSLLKSIRY
jgi:FMN phosphatase YigB (HAD superfamily)